MVVGAVLYNVVAIYYACMRTNIREFDLYKVPLILTSSIIHNNYVEYSILYCVAIQSTYIQYKCATIIIW